MLPTQYSEPWAAGPDDIPDEDPPEFPLVPEVEPWPIEDDPSEPFIEFPEVMSWDVYQPVY